MARTSLSFFLLGCIFFTTAVSAVETRIFQTDSRTEVEQGTLDGVSADALGRIMVARDVERLAAIAEPFVFAAAGTDDGWIVGTGNAGKVLKVSASGEVSELWTAEDPEIQIHAVTIAPDGTIYAATSPLGKVYALRDGGAELVFDPETTYIWGITHDAQGRLLVATGLDGRLIRVETNWKTRESKAEVLWESPDDHVRSLAVLPDGSILAGTAGRGLIVRVSPDGTVRALRDAAQPEVIAFALRDDGGAYIAAAASEASQVDLSASAATSANGDGEAEGAEAEVAEVTVSAGQTTVGSRAAGEQGPRSVIFDLRADGVLEEVLSFREATVHSLALDGDDLWIGTGQEGRLLRWRVGTTMRDLRSERELDGRQITALAAGGAGLAAFTTNASAVYRVRGSERVDEGTFTSRVLDAGSVARWGALRWEGELPRGASAVLSARSGLAAEPDGTWTPWERFGEGREADLEDLSPGRYVQWRAVLRGAASLQVARLSYRQENLRPEIQSFEVLEPGKIIVPSSFSPQDQAYEPWSPNREGIFDTLKPADPSRGSTRELWKRGYRALRWTAKDANSDSLRYALSFRAEDDDEWLPMAEDLDQTYFSFDVAALPDGRYRFRIEASDIEANPGGTELVADLVSPSATIDNTPPRVISRKEKGAIAVEIEDALSPIREAQISIDAGAWRPVGPADGLFDERRETLLVETPEDAKVVLLRVRDAAYNVVSFRLTDAEK